METHLVSKCQSVWKEKKKHKNSLTQKEAREAREKNNYKSVQFWQRLYSYPLTIGGVFVLLFSVLLRFSFALPF